MNSQRFNIRDGVFSSGIPGIGIYQYAAKQPSWISRAAMLVFALVITLPILLLFALAIILAVVVFAALLVYSRITNGVRRLFTKPSSILSRKRDEQGRQNVTVLPPK